MWKARKEETIRQLESSHSFSSNPYNRNQAIRAAGQEAKYLDRVEQLMRE